MDLTPREAAKRVVGHHMRAFLGTPDARKAGISAIVSSHYGWGGGGSWGQVGPKGVGVSPDDPAACRDPRSATVFVTWAEIGAAVDRGATPDRRAAFDAAWALWAAWIGAGGYNAHPHPHKDAAAEAAAEAHQQAYADATRAVRAAADAILDAGFGVANGPVQGDLLELLGGAPC